MIPLASATLLAWVYLLALHGRFWQGGPSLAPQRFQVGAAPAVAPTVVVVVPARNEAGFVAASIASLLAQDYPGRMHIITVDDCSSDTTSEAASLGAAIVVAGRPRLPGWSGKLWAVAQGLAVAERYAPDYVLLTDADIVHQPLHIATLVAQAERLRADLVSEMVGLACDSEAERLLVPAFVYFFQLLYPFAWVAEQHRRTAAAAGGTILLRREALARIGGIEAVRGALIDDVALAARVKQAGGRIWLGHSQTARSLRPYPRAADVWRMVARSAYVQLCYSPARLAACIGVMALVFLAPALIASLAPGAARWIGAAAWIACAASFLPTLRRFRLSPWRAFTLPAAAAFYLAATLGSALDHHRGRGVVWKDRAYQRVET